MDIFLDVVGVAAEFSANSNGGASSGSVGRGDQRLPCSLSCFGKWEIVQGACTMVICIAILITSVIASAAISEIENHTENNEVQLKDYITTKSNGHAETFKIGGSRTAAGLLIFISCAGIFFHFVIISVRVFYIYTGKRDHMNLYIGLALFLITVFVIGYFIGGVVNIIQFVDVNSLSRDCGDTRKVCQALERLAGCQIASFALSISASVVYLFLCMPTCFTGCKNYQEDSEDPPFRSHHVRTTSAPTRVQENTPSTTNTPSTSMPSTNGAPFISKYASPSISKELPSHTTNGQPTHPSTDPPPSYEAAVGDSSAVI